MLDVRIHKFETRYRLPSSEQAEHRRLDQLRTKVVDQAFAQAFKVARLPEEGELCIRKVFAPVSLHLKGTDDSLVAHWSMVLADEIIESISDGLTGGAVVYHSRRQALVDLAVSVGRGDLRRSWAWRQLGLWRAGDFATGSQSVSELVGCLCNEPAMIVPVLRALAESSSLQGIAGRLTEQHWKWLAVTALSGVGAADLLNQRGETPSARAVREAWRVVDRSRVLRAIASSGSLAEINAVVGRSIAVLAVLDAEPTLLQGSSASMVVSIVGDATSARYSQSMDSRAAHAAFNQSSRVSADAKPANQSTPDAVEMAAALTPDQAADPNDDFLAPLGRAEDADIAAGRTVQSRGKDKSARGHGPANPSSRIVELKENAKPLDLRQRAFTRWGGLFFLFAVIEDLSLPELILEHPVLSGRRFAWVIHQLAITLAANDLDSKDPAALAFAGLPPDATPPSEQEEPASEIEALELCQLAASIIDRLSSLIDFEPEPPAGLIEFVCRRRAEIVADPGWIEVRLSLDEVSTEIRRVGLDLNPGYVPWLGVVVRFVYE